MAFGKTYMRDDGVSVALVDYTTGVVPKNLRDIYGDEDDWHYVQFTLRVKNGSKAALPFAPDSTITFEGHPVTEYYDPAGGDIEPGQVRSVHVQAFIPVKDRGKSVDWVQVLSTDGDSVVFRGHLPSAK